MNRMFSLLLGALLSAGLLMSMTACGDTTDTTTTTEGEVKTTETTTSPEGTSTTETKVEKDVDEGAVTIEKSTETTTETAE